tara:strand:+ start:133 stop:1071 length:939 start_codon:yes stop_codon:yes gene_type:complete
MLKFFLTIFLLLNFIFNTTKSFGAQSSIIAKVENRIISSYDLKQKVKTTLFLSRQELTQNNIDSIKRPALRSLIDLRLKEEELSKLNLPIENNKNVNDYLIEIASKYDTDISGFEKLFELNQIDFEKYNKEIQIEFAWQRLIFRIYGKKININNNEVDEELSNFIKNQKSIVEYKLAEIEIKINNPSEREKEAEKIQKQIVDIGFENTAVKYSISSSSLNGGDIGWVSSKSLSQTFYEKVKKIKKGEVSKPIFQGNSIIFLKLNDIKNLTIDNVNSLKIKESIINAKKNEYLNMFSNNHLSKLKNNALIVIK